MAKTLLNILTFKRLYPRAPGKMVMATTLLDAQELYVRANRSAVSLRCMLYSSMKTGFLRDGPSAIPPKNHVSNFQTRIGNPIVPLTGIGQCKSLRVLIDSVVPGKRANRKSEVLGLEDIYIGRANIDANAWTGKKEDMTGNALYYADLGRPVSQRFKDMILSKPEIHPRTATVETLHFFA